MLREFIDVFEKPTEFFQKERCFATGFVLFLISAVVNAVLTELLLQMKLVDFGFVLDPYFSVAVKTALSIAGFFVISAICALLMKALGGQNIVNFYKVVSYSLTVLIFLWVPHMLVAAIVFAWFIILMVFGMKQYNGLNYKKGIAVVIVFVAIVVVLAFFVHDYLHVPIFPWKLR